MTPPKPVKAFVALDGASEMLIDTCRRNKDSLKKWKYVAEVEIMPVEQVEAMRKVIQAAYHVCLCIDKINQEAYLETLSDELKAYDNLTAKDEK